MSSATVTGGAWPAAAPGASGARGPGWSSRWLWPGSQQLCWSPPPMPGVSANLQRLLILINIALGLFKLNFFSLREKKQSHGSQWLWETVTGWHRADCERPGNTATATRVLEPGLPALSLPGPGQASGAAGQELGRWKRQCLLTGREHLRPKTGTLWFERQR